MVIERHRFAGFQPVQPDAEVIKVSVALAAESTDGPHLVMQPTSHARVNDKPSRARRDPALDRRLAHVLNLRNRNRANLSARGERLTATVVQDTAAPEGDPTALKPISRHPTASARRSSVETPAAADSGRRQRPLVHNFKSGRQPGPAAFGTVVRWRRRA